MISNWQSWAAPVVVLVTAAIMLYRGILKRKTGCGSGCGCNGKLVKNKIAVRNQKGLSD